MIFSRGRHIGESVDQYVADKTVYLAELLAVKYKIRLERRSSDHYRHALIHTSRVDISSLITGGHATSEIKRSVHVHCAVLTEWSTINAKLL